jgi:hypothetical protein
VHNSKGEEANPNPNFHERRNQNLHWARYGYQGLVASGYDQGAWDSTDTFFSFREICFFSANLAWGPKIDASQQYELGKRSESER